jgi:hypothetical protein
LFIKKTIYFRRNRHRKRFQKGKNDVFGLPHDWLSSTDSRVNQAMENGHRRMAMVTLWRAKTTIKTQMIKHGNGGDA